VVSTDHAEVNKSASPQVRRHFPTEGFIRPVPDPFEMDEPEIRFMDDEMKIIDAELVLNQDPRAEEPDILFID
jgi:hypothetical protein